ncbi:nicotinate (nicotinamide) nucleotide adenylyltransferase, partial [Rhodoferax sp. 4810]|nr:nicotinate (nicotinamide) nucleotide adenylyltransferase [Rhodoferax jenense]
MADTGSQRIGILGGAFDPPHLAHLALAKAAIEQLQLDQLRIIPTGQAWHKPRLLTDAVHRLAMAQLAFAELPQAQVDDRETRRTGPSYTIDTLHELHAEAAGAQLFLIIGADQAQALTTWHAWEQILRSAIICVADR